jgi:hypothetical protein
MWEILQKIVDKVTLINLMIFILVMVEIVHIIKDYNK